MHYPLWSIYSQWSSKFHHFFFPTTFKKLIMASGNQGTTIIAECLKHIHSFLFLFPVITAAVRICFIGSHEPVSISQLPCWDLFWFFQTSYRGQKKTQKSDTQHFVSKLPCWRQTMHFYQPCYSLQTHQPHLFFNYSSSGRTMKFPSNCAHSQLVSVQC